MKLEGSNRGPIRWLADTGCAADLIGLNDMTPGDLERIEQTPDPVCFSSANGPVWATSTLPLQGIALMEEMNPIRDGADPGCLVDWAKVHATRLLVPLAGFQVSVLREARR